MLVEARRVVEVLQHKQRFAFTSIVREVLGDARVGHILHGVGRRKTS